MLAVRVEKPPVARVVKACATASNGPIPATTSKRANAPVRATYTPHREVAVSATRGVSFSDWAPENSARYRCMPPCPTSGRTAMTKTTIPMPPSHEDRARQSRMGRESDSTSERIEAPVVVTPEVASKTASVTLAMPGASTKGKLPNKLAPSHTATVNRMPSRWVSSRRAPRQASQSAMPAPLVRPAEPTRAARSSPPVASEYAAGMPMLAPNAVKNSPRTRPIRIQWITRRSYGGSFSPRTEIPTRARCLPARR